MTKTIAPDARIAVIGGGAKAAAIAAKADCLRKAKIKDIQVTIFERADVLAANWGGEGGYTDGKQELCTPTLHDLGYPYDDQMFDAAVAHEMQARYSWMAFAVRRPYGSEGHWADLSEARPKHRRFADYLTFAMEQSGADLKTGWTVDRLLTKGHKWSVEAKPSVGGAAVQFNDFDGVVVTGPGPARPTFGKFSHPLLFNAEDVWRRLPELKGAIEASTGEIVIIGAGGAGAAIAAWLISAGFENRQFTFVAKQATIYTRSSGHFEQLMFESDDEWQQLGLAERDEFVDRLTRSVVWQAVAERLKRATAISIAPGLAQSISVISSPAGTPYGLQVTYQPSNRALKPLDVEGCVVIDAAGFNPWWFTKLLPSPWNVASTAELKIMAGHMSYQLCLPLTGLPPLHVPMSAQAIGPGYGSLLVLGRMADRVLNEYVYGGSSR